MKTKQIEQIIIKNLANTQYRHTNGLLESLVSETNEEASIIDIVEEFKEGEKMFNTIRFASRLDSKEGRVKTEKREVARFEKQSRKVDRPSMEAYLKGESTLVTDLVSAMINQVLKHIDTTLISMYEEIRGNNSYGCNGVIKVTESHLFANLSAISSEFFSNNIDSQYIVVGGNTLDRNVRMLDGDTSNFCFVDSNMNANNLGNSDWFAYAAGTIKLLEFNNVEDFTQIYVPTADNTPFSIQFNVSYDEDNETYDLTLVKFFDLFDPYMNEYGVNQMFRVRPNLDMLV